MYLARGPLSIRGGKLNLAPPTVAGAAGVSAAGTEIIAFFPDMATFPIDR